MRRQHTKASNLGCLIAACCLIALSGCGVTLRPSAEEAIGQATGVEEAVQFSTEEIPVDVGEPGATLTLVDSVKRALRTDAGLQAALARVRAALAAADQARLLPNPILSVAFRLSGAGGGADIDAGLSQDLISVLQRPFRAGATESRLHAASAEAVTTALDVLAAVKSAYATVQTLDESIALLTTRRELVGRLVEVSKIRLQGGEGTVFDVTVFESQRVELEVEIASRELARREARLSVARMIGAPSSEAAWQVEPWSAPAFDSKPESEWVKRSLERRPEVQARAWELSALGEELAVQAFAPFDGSAVGLSSERNDGDWGIGPALGTVLPFFDFGQARRDKVRAERAEARHKLLQTRRAVIEEVRKAYATFSSVKANLKRVREALIPLQRDRRTLAEQAYRAGETNLLSVLLAEQDLRSAEEKAIELERQTSDALSRLERAAGGMAVPQPKTETMQR